VEEMSGREVGGAKQGWAVRGERKNGKLNMVVPASVAGQEEERDVSGHY